MLLCQQKRAQTSDVIIKKLKTSSSTNDKLIHTRFQTNPIVSCTKCTKNILSIIEPSRVVSSLHKNQVTCPHDNTPSILNSLPLITSIRFMIFRESNCCQKQNLKFKMSVHTIVLKMHLNESK